MRLSLSHACQKHARVHTYAYAHTRICPDASVGTCCVGLGLCLYNRTVFTPRAPLATLCCPAAAARPWRPRESKTCFRPRARLPTRRAAPRSRKLPSGVCSYPSTPPPGGRALLYFLMRARSPTAGITPALLLSCWCCLLLTRRVLCSISCHQAPHASNRAPGRQPSTAPSTAHRPKFARGVFCCMATRSRKPTSAPGPEPLRGRASTHTHQTYAHARGRSRGRARLGHI